MTDAPSPLPPAAAAPRAMVFVRDAAAQDVIRRSLSELGVTDAVFAAGDIAAAIADGSNRSALQLLIVDLGGAADPLAQVSTLMDGCSPSTGVIVLGESNDLSLYRHLKDAGVSEYIFKPLVGALVTKACKRVLTGEHEREAAPVGQLVLVMGVRGGAGATSIAVRTALRLSQSPPRPVLLLDLYYRFGDAALQLDATPNMALCEALQSVERVDPLFIERGVIHVSDRLDLMASLDDLAHPLAFNEETLLTLIEHLQRRYRYVVVDVPGSHASLFLNVLKLPSTLLLVSDGRLASARDVRRWRAALGPDTPERRTLHILNRGGAPGALSVEDFTRAVGQAPDAVIAESREIALATNMGVHARPDCPELMRGLAPVFQHISGAPVEPQRSLLSRLLG